MASRNPQPNHPPRSSRTPQSVRATRSARAAQSGRIASRGAARSFAQQSDASGNGGRSSREQDAPRAGGYRAAYTPGNQGKNSYSRQAPASGQYSRNNPGYSKKANKGMSRGKKIALGTLCTVLVLVLGAGTAFAVYVNNLNNTLAGNKTDVERTAIQDTLVPTKNFTDPFYMMLIGSDAREDDEEMGQRSDTNILVYVDPVQCIVSMVSIPRDTMIEIDGYGTNKFNAAYNYGADATIREASQLCGVDIAHYAEIDFQQLMEMVNAVGGVEVEVQERIDDPDAGRVVIEEGTQTLNGEAALVFARSRAYADGDFTRTSNQRILIEALIKKVLSLPITEMPGVIEAAAESVTTDLTINDILGLAMQFKELDRLTMYSAMVPSTTGYIGDVSYVFADEVALKEMMALVGAGKDASGVVASGVVPSGATSSGGSGNSTYSDTSGGYDSTYQNNQNQGYESPPSYAPGYEESGGDTGGGTGDSGQGGDGSGSGSGNGGTSSGDAMGSGNGGSTGN